MKNKLPRSNKKVKKTAFSKTVNSLIARAKRGDQAAIRELAKNITHATVRRLLGKAITKLRKAQTKKSSVLSVNPKEKQKKTRFERIELKGEKPTRAEKKVKQATTGVSCPLCGKRMSRGKLKGHKIQEHGESGRIPKDTPSKRKGKSLGFVRIVSGGGPLSWC